jgi:hypothetical protein
VSDGAGREPPGLCPYLSCRPVIPGVLQHASPKVAVSCLATLVLVILTSFMQLLSGLAALHGNWIIHRDLKTSNLLLDNRGMVF